MARRAVISVKLEGTERTISAFRALDRNVRIEIGHAVKEHLEAVYNRAYRDCPKDTNETAESLYWNYEPATGGGYVASSSKNAVFLEFGTKPHPENPPPPGALEEWMIRHGMDPEEEDELLFFLGQHGTPAQPFLVPAWETERPRFMSRFRRRVTTAVARSAQRR